MKEEYRAECMDEALAIAFRRMGWTAPNPPVGAVIVKNGRVIATGATGPSGVPHAEVDAITRAGRMAHGAEIYVSLEPCCHHGKTPPCTDVISAAGLTRVTIPILDPNPLVSGKGVAALASSGIEVRFSEKDADRAVDLYRPFKKSILRKRPFIISKSAVTLDGRTAAMSGDSRWISSEVSRCLTHRLRAKVDAVIIGKGTFIADNPALTARPGSFGESVERSLRENQSQCWGRDNYLLASLVRGDIGALRNPLRVVIGLPERIEPDAPLIADDNHIFFETSERIDRLTGKGGALEGVMGRIRVHPVDADSSVDMIGRVLDELYRRGVMCALLEGGGTLAGSFHDAGEIDQYLYLIAPRIAGNGLPSIAGAGVERIADALSLHDMTVMPVGGDVWITGYRSPYHFEML